MASFAALGGGCGSVLAPQIVKLFSQLRPHLKESPAMNDIYLALCHNPEIRAALLALAIYVTYNWLPRTPPATQPFRALWVVAEHLTWTSWQQAGVNYKGGLGPMPKLARKMVAEDSLLPGASDAPEDIDVTVIPAAHGVPK
jgi:hypothetical protein